MRMLRHSVMEDAVTTPQPKPTAVALCNPTLTLYPLNKLSCPTWGCPSRGFFNRLEVNEARAVELLLLSLRKFGGT